MEASKENSLNTENWCRTEINVVNFSYKWIITNFCMRPERIGEYIKSSTFSDKEYDQYKWCLNLYPRGVEGFVESVALELELVSNTPVMANYKTSILNDKHVLLPWKQHATYQFVPGLKIGLNNYFEPIIPSENQIGFVPDNTFTIICDITMILDTVNITNKDKVLKKPDCECKIIQDLGHLFENMKFSDFTLIVGDSKIKAHKNILAARSAVFEAMFEHEMEESKSNSVYITDISYEAVREMIRFIYTGKISNFNNTADELLIAAEKYDLKDLKKLCEMELCDKMCVEEAVDMLILADFYRADDLRAKSIEFIRAHIVDVLKTEGWQNMIASHKNLTTDIVEVIAKRNGPPRK